MCKSGLFQRGWRTLRESGLSAGLSITARVSVLQPTLGGRKVQIVLLTNTVWLRIQREGWELCWLWMALVVHSATVHPPPSSKQAKVTSGSPGLHILWLVVYVMWRWEQRVVDADSKEGISTSYSMCVCVVCVRACVRAHVMRAWLCPVCMCICVTAMRLMLQIVCSLLSRKWKLYCSEHARFKSLLPPYVLITKKKKHKLKDVSPAKTPRRSRREFQINAAWPEKDIWTNANADKMAAVAKLTGGRKKMELNAVWKSCMLISQQPKRKNTHRQSQNFSHLVRVARAAKSSLFAYFLKFSKCILFRMCRICCVALLSKVSWHHTFRLTFFKKKSVWFGFISISLCGTRATSAQHLRAEVVADFSVRISANVNNFSPESWVTSYMSKMWQLHMKVCLNRLQLKALIVGHKESLHIFLLFFFFFLSLCVNFGKPCER